MRYLIFIVAISLFSCSQKTGEMKESTRDTDSVSQNGFDENNYESFINLDNYIAASASDDDTQTIDSACVILVNPTEEQIKKMEEEYGDDFATIADDNSFYQSEATSKLDSASVKIITAEKQFLKLKGLSTSWTLDVRKEGAPEWNVIFFNPKKKPEVISAIDVTYDKINAYFDR